ncbi:MAG: dephospho-CoA kinase [Magnetococcales bacterium]|nr:dephospho-CoA kinase [Magnetococcales bacterium]
MLVVGVTGAMGCGKSSAAGWLTAHESEALRLDADVLAREAVAPGTEGWRRIVAHFGPEATLGEGPLAERPLNRRWLAERVFADDEERRVLEGMIHPEVWRRMGEALAAWATAHPRGWVVLDVPLLFESGQEGRCDLTVVVTCGGARASRLAGREGEGMSTRAQQGAMAGQWSEEAKRARADRVIDNGGDWPETLRQLEGLKRELSQRAAAGEGEAWPRRWRP